MAVLFDEMNTGCVDPAIDGSRSDADDSGCLLRRNHPDAGATPRAPRRNRSSNGLTEDKLISLDRDLGSLRALLLHPWPVLNRARFRFAVASSSHFKIESGSF